MADERENQFTKDLLQIAEEESQAEMEAKGLGQGYDLWRESMNERVPNQAVKDQFLWGADAETSALSGQLSVASPESEEGVGTTPPAPGPDDEGTRPDEAGDTSQGGDRPEADDRLAQLVWEPPQISEAVNYEPPSTNEMAESDEWIENAWKFYEFMGSPDLVPGGPGDPRSRKAYVEDYRKKYPMSDSEIADWARKEISGFNWNLLITTKIAREVMTRDDPESAIAVLNLINMYDHSDGGTADFFRAVGGILTDPTTYLGLGVGSAAAKGTAKLVSKQGLKKAVQFAITGAAAGAVEGGMLAGGFDLTKQNIEQEAKVREDLDYGQAAVATGIGAGLGIGLGGFGGHLAGRYADKVAAGADKQLAKDLFGQTRAERIRTLQEDDTGQMLRELIEASERASELAGVDDNFGSMAMRLVTDDDVMPRLEDGTPDIDEIARRLDELTQSREAKSKAQKEAIEAEREAILGRRASDQPANDDQGGVLKDIERDEDNTFNLRHGEDFDPDVDDGAAFAEEVISEFEWWAETAGIEDFSINTWSDGAQDVTSIRFSSEEDSAKFWELVTGKPYTTKTPKGQAPLSKRTKVEPVPTEESRKLAERIAELEELKEGGLVHAAPGRKGSTISDELGNKYELIGRTKNGWYKGRRIGGAGEEKNFRRAQFKVDEVAPPPEMAGAMELSPFSNDAAEIIAMAESITNRPLTEINATHKEQQKIADSLAKKGIDITVKDMASYWTPSELLFLRNVYDRMARHISDYSRKLASVMDNGQPISDTDLAFFNAAHAKFMTVRDLFYGVRGNAARMLNVLRSKPTEQAYDFTQTLIDSIATQGGRAQTERAIKLMADEVSRKGVKGAHDAAPKIWGSRTAQALLNWRYNIMLSSWRTHFFNFLGNSASGVYEHLLVSPTKMAINNVEYAARLAKSHVTGKAPDPAERLTMESWKSEFRGHMSAARDSLVLAKEIALGRDIGEGKIWNELGLRYDVVNVPDSMFAKLGTTPVRLLEAGDAFFKNQYFNSKLHFLAERKARYDSVHNGADFKTRYHEILDEPPPSMYREAQDYAAKMTYTNDPNVYGGILAGLARGAQSLQSSHWVFNMVLPFVRTPANLLSYSMEMIGANAVLSPSTTWAKFKSTNPLDRQDAMAKIMVAGGLWAYVYDKYRDGQITGAGPPNYEERKSWEASGWQANSIMVHGKWVELTRAAPAGQSLAAMATVFDYATLTDKDDMSVSEWIGAGILFTADMIKDESYLSTITDAIVVMESKEEARGRAIAASTLNSFIVPNFLRDIRRVTDETMRSGSAPDLLQQMAKQQLNATPGLSSNLPPQRDWMGKPKNYFGNAYFRGLVPFNVKDSTKQDPASMAIAYARIPLTTPSRRFAVTDRDLSINLMAMDKGGGFVYDKYLQIVGESRHEVVSKVIDTEAWKKLVADNEVGPGSFGEQQLRSAIATGSRIGRARFLQFVMETDQFKTDDGRLVQIQHPVSKDEYRRMAELVLKQREQVPEELPQYDFKEKKEGPEFFKAD